MPAQSEQNDSDKLMHFTQLVRDLRRLETSPEQLSAVLDHTLAMFPLADWAAIQLYHGQAHARNRDPEEICYEVPVDQTVVDAVLDSGQAVTLGDFICVAISDGKQHVVGVVYLLTEQQDRLFADADLDLLQCIATQVSFVVEIDHLRQASLPVETELEVLGSIREAFLPKIRPQAPGYEFYDFHTAISVYGDHYE